MSRVDITALEVRATPPRLLPPRSERGEAGSPETRQAVIEAGQTGGLHGRLQMLGVGGLSEADSHSMSND